jgi:hypothetical protein
MKKQYRKLIQEFYTDNGVLLDILATANFPIPNDTITLKVEDGEGNVICNFNYQLGERGI